MSNLALIWYPWKGLREIAKPLSLEEINSRQFAKNVSRMFSTMYYRGGVGLAAPQMGWDANLFIANPYGRKAHNTEGRIFINPTVSVSGLSIVEKEGCLSFPGIFANVLRKDQATINYIDNSGEIKEQKYSGFVARIIQHEYDHLKGVLFIDRLTDEQKEEIKPQLDAHRAMVRRIRKERDKRYLEAKARRKKKRERRRKQRNRRKGNK